MTNTNFGTIKHEGKTLTLTQQAYVAGTTQRPHYEAAAVDAAGNEYRVRWSLKPALIAESGDAVPMDQWPEDESDCCDWSKYEVLEA